MRITLLAMGLGVVLWSAAASAEGGIPSAGGAEPDPAVLLDAPRVTVPQGPVNPQTPQVPVTPQSPVATSELPTGPAEAVGPARLGGETEPGVPADPVRSVGPGEFGPGALGLQ